VLGEVTGDDADGDNGRTVVSNQAGEASGMHTYSCWCSFCFYGSHREGVVGTPPPLPLPLQSFSDCCPVGDVSPATQLFECIKRAMCLTDLCATGEICTSYEANCLKTQRQKRGAWKVKSCDLATCTSTPLPRQINEVADVMCALRGSGVSSTSVIDVIRGDMYVPSEIEGLTEHQHVLYMHRGVQPLAVKANQNPLLVVRFRGCPFPRVSR
jgi:hypothetical protein